MEMRRQSRTIGPVWMLTICACAVLCGSTRARAELDVQMELEYSSVLQFESAFAFVTIHNTGVTPFNIDTDPGSGEVLLVVNLKGGEWLPKLREGRILERLRIDVGKSRRVPVDVGRWYDIRELGGYFVQAQVNWMGRTYVSNRMLVDVVPGIEIRKVKRNALGYEELARTYSLRYWARARGEYLFLRVDEEPSGLNYGVFLLGSLVRIFDPQVEVDVLGNITILHQSGVGSFTRSVFRADRDSVLFVEQTYHLEDGAPHPGIGPKR